MLEALDPEWSGVVLCDVRMQGMDGFAVLQAAREAAPEVPLLMMTGHGDVRMAIAAVKAGAYDFLEKPVQPDYLLSLLNRTLGARRLVLENRRLRRRVARFGDMRTRLIGKSAAMKACRKQLLSVAPLPLTVTLCGEPGTGKELAARALHDFSEVTGDYSAINCATVSEASLREALDDAGPDGTFFLRGLHQLDAAAQSVLADYLRRKRRARIVTSITGHLETPLQAGTLSEELYYLVSTAPIELPPLRDREKDVFVLLETFLRDAAQRFDGKLPQVTKEMLEPFRKYPWPGNVRELRNVAERMVLGLPVDLSTQRRATPEGGYPSYEEAMKNFERSLLEHALVETGGRKGEAAALLSIPRKRLYLRMKAMGLSD
jgi:two-component system C4-dicarboxylate transport response regulator DctD